MAIKGLEQAIENLSRISKTAVPGAAAMAIKVKDLTPGELTAESYDDSYLDDEDADWTATGHLLPVR